MLFLYFSTQKGQLSIMVNNAILLSVPWILLLSPCSMFVLYLGHYLECCAPVSAFVISVMHKFKKILKPQLFYHYCPHEIAKVSLCSALDLLMHHSFACFQSWK
jgi:hypothetical protein